MIRPLPALATAAVLVALLSGCSVSVIDGTDTPASTTRGEPAKEVPSASPDAAPTDEGEHPLPNAGTGLDRDSITAAATTVRRCDSSGELTILDDAVVARVEGTCKRIILNSKGSMLVTDDVTSLEVIGDANLVLTGSVDQVLVNGMGNTVHWSGATPTVSDVGSGNTLTAG
ncbi:DUF3060 domain-containing protein [Microbacterium sp. 69-10]|uniref:DUF3060 domain-containing protein n=1 Tax=Microbacterium sp. 69-10 TaxID=1895783 RepID=UPI0025F79401|nr:DUF3060 domain-containing protein [Microbacterium sp. 69-10]